MRLAAALILMAAVSIPASAQLLSRRAPGFSLPDMLYRQHDLQDHRGKVVILDFMRTDCPSCRELTRTLETIKSKYGNRIQVFSVITLPDNHETVRRYIGETKATSTFLFDCGQMTASFLQITPQNPTIHLPRLLLVDKSGNIRKDIADSRAGGFGVASVSAALDELLK